MLTNIRVLRLRSADRESLGDAALDFWFHVFQFPPYPLIREFKQIATAGADTAAGSKFSSKCDTAHARRLHLAVARNLTARVGMFCRSGYYVGFMSLLWPFSTDFSTF